MQRNLVSFKPSWSAANEKSYKINEWIATRTPESVGVGKFCRLRLREKTTDSDSAGMQATVLASYLEHPLLIPRNIWGTNLFVEDLLVDVDKSCRSPSGVYL